MKEQAMIDLALELGFANAAMMDTKDLIFMPSFRPLCAATPLLVALQLGRPLLIEGPAGVGKTEIAKVMASALDRELSNSSSDLSISSIRSTTGFSDRMARSRGRSSRYSLLNRERVSSSASRRFICTWMLRSCF